MPEPNSKSLAAKEILASVERLSSRKQRQEVTGSREEGPVVREGGKQPESGQTGRAWSCAEATSDRPVHPQEARVPGEEGRWSREAGTVSDRKGTKRDRRRYQVTSNSLGSTLGDPWAVLWGTT